MDVDKSILIVEDSEEVIILIRHIIGKYHRLHFSRSIQDARISLNRETFDLILLDLGLPDGNGLDFLAELKSTVQLSMIPIILLTAKTSIQAKTTGFQLGIDDFIEKPFDHIEFRLRINSRLNKNETLKKNSAVIKIGNIQLDYSKQQATFETSGNSIDIPLSPKEFGILFVLLKNVDRIISRDQLISMIWGQTTHIIDRTIDSHICRIRKKIHATDIQISAVPNSGYKLFIRQEK